jgi:hypothetical protein
MRQGESNGARARASRIRAEHDMDATVLDLMRRRADERRAFRQQGTHAPALTFAAVLALCMELVAVCGTAMLGADLASGIWIWAVGVGAAALFATAWGIWAAPRSSRRLAGSALFVFKLGAFALGAVGVATAYGWPIGTTLFVLALCSLAVLGVNHAAPRGAARR